MSPWLLFCDIPATVPQSACNRAYQGSLDHPRILCSPGKRSSNGELPNLAFPTCASTRQRPSESHPEDESGPSWDKLPPLSSLTLEKVKAPKLGTLI